MATNFPTSLDSNPGDPTPNETLKAGGHANLHTFAQDAIIAIEGYIGAIGSAITTSLTYKLTNTASVDPGHKHTVASLPSFMAFLNAAQTWTANQLFGAIGAVANASINFISGTYNTIQTYTPAAAGTATLDLSKGNVQHITMPAGNITIAISNGNVGQCFLVRILQDSGGSRTVTWFNTIKWPGGTVPTLSTGANKADTFGFEITGVGTYDGFIVGQNL